MFLLKAENSCHIPRHINCLVIFQQGAQTHQRKMLEHIQNTQFSEHHYNQGLVLSVIVSLCYGDSIDLTLADEDLSYFIYLSTDRSKTVEESGGVTLLKLFMHLLWKTVKYWLF